MNIEIVKMTDEHLDGVCAIENESFPDPWNRASFESELENDAAHWFVAMSDGKIAGYMGFYAAADEGDISNIAVGKDFRRLGIGALLMEYVLAYADKNGIRFMALEVRESNAPAIGLYEKYGFVKVGIRKRYYQSNGEDAIIMIKEW